MTDAVDLPGDGIQGGSPPRPEGNGASRRNAMKQSSAADTLLPEILRADLIDTYYRRLCEELQPATPTAEFLVREMARHEAALARIEQMEEAVLRRGLVTWFTAIEMLLNRPGHIDGRARGGNRHPSCGDATRRCQKDSRSGKIT